MTFQCLGGRLHDLHQQAVGHGLPRIRPCRVLLGLERHMELVAEVIGMDPLEFRKKNLLKPVRPR